MKTYKTNCKFSRQVLETVEDLKVLEGKREKIRPPLLKLGEGGGRVEEVGVEGKVAGPRLPLVHS